VLNNTRYPSQNRKHNLEDIRVTWRPRSLCPALIWGASDFSALQKQSVVAVPHLMADVKDADQIMMQSAGVGDFGMSMHNGNTLGAGTPAKKKSRSSRDAAAIKRRCVSTACIACRRRKSKCDGNTPSCAACSSVYGTGE
jgi:hypothetical protein